MICLGAQTFNFPISRDYTVSPVSSGPAPTSTTFQLLQLRLDCHRLVIVARCGACGSRFLSNSEDPSTLIQHHTVDVDVDVMTFQTSVLRDGQWVTEIRSVHDIKASSSSAKASKKQAPLQAPQYGMLTQTVVEGQQVNLILPVRLRSGGHNDIAFVRDHSVHIFEVAGDGQSDDPVEVCRTSKLASRIRNATVIGEFFIPDDGRGQEDGLPKFPASSPPSFAHNTSASLQLPPQQLLLVLENGDFVFLFAEKRPSNHWVLVPTYYPNRTPAVEYMGSHIAVDPSSRYVVQASYQEYFTVYELKSYQEQNEEYQRRGKATCPIRSFCSRTIRGGIHKVVFLYPRPEDVSHVILLLIVVRNGMSRMVIYDWEVGDRMNDVFATEKQGYRMTHETQMPMLVIPLTVRSAFMTVSPPDCIAVWTGALHSPPSPSPIEMECYPPTSIHYGEDAPLWTTWTRPLRIRSFFKSCDFIYLARDDGVVIYLQADEDADVQSNRIARLDCKIYKAFASVFHKFADALLVGGASGPGGMWLAAPREKLKDLASLPSAAPALDFVTTYGGRVYQAQESTFGQVDRIFTVSGCGTTGAITEYRYGLKAAVGIEWEYRKGLKRAWLMPYPLWVTPEGWNIILSYPDSTKVLRLPADFGDCVELEEDDTLPYDDAFSTLALQYVDDLLVQVTTQHVVLQLAGVHRPTRRWKGVPFEGQILDAAIRNKHIAALVEHRSRYHLRVCEIDVVQLSLEMTRSYLFPEGCEVNCLAWTDDFVAAAMWDDDRPFLVMFEISGPSDLYRLDLLALLRDQGRVDYGALEPIASIICFTDQILLGTRSGEVITLSGSDGNYTIDIQKFGITTAYLTCQALNPSIETVFICCEGNVISPRRLNSYSRPRTQYLQVFPVDEADLRGATPPVSFAALLRPSLEVPGCYYALFESGSTLRIATVTPDSGQVQRRMPILGSPTKCLHSRILDCLVVAVNHEGTPTLRFIDYNNGVDVGRPTDKDNNQLPFISGLGKTGDRILALEPWRFEKDGSVWEYILVSTSSGRLIVVDTKVSDGFVKYWTRFTIKEPGVPISTVLGCEKGLIYCAGNTVYWDILVTEARRLKRIKSFRLGSPATSLRMENGKLMVLTSKDSLLVTDHSAMDDGSQPSLCHADLKTRNGAQMITLSLGAPPEQDITLVADYNCGVGGLWVPWEFPLKNCEPVFETELTGSIRRFRRGHVRPPWQDPHYLQLYGRLFSTPDDADVLGISIDGSLHHFMLIDVNTWRLLRFIQNLAETDGGASRHLLWEAQLGTSQSSRSRPDPEPKLTTGLEMQVNGDTLRLCVESRALEGLLADHTTRLMELMDAMEGGRWTYGLSRDAGSYISLVYDVIEYYIRRPFQEELKLKY